jgi:hypothetical protein
MQLLGFGAANQELETSRNPKRLGSGVRANGDIEGFSTMPAQLHGFTIDDASECRKLWNPNLSCRLPQQGQDRHAAPVF